ncbi:MAG: FtsW/RodA/SpoVE family cell cycle protein [Oscillospiraceae bacterium]|nr:FtsW/RodA/SpoVE family cell cycle protein [Oscillospiraceae bacterium]
MLGKIRDFSKSVDKLYLLLCITCSALSVLTLISWCMFNMPETYSFFNRYHDAIVQAFAAGMGLVMALIISRMDYHTMASLWPLHAGVAWGMVLLTFLRMGPFGYAPAGTENYSWIVLPAGLSIQPTEIAKISFIITFALHLSKVKEELNRPAVLWRVLLHWAAPVLLIHFQGDDGTAIIFFLIGAFMIFAAGLSYKYILAVIGVALITSPLWGPFLWDKMGAYQQNRILALFDPDAYDETMYQQKRGQISIGAGRITGRGLFSPDHHNVPESNNDFIFSYLSEALGFIGSMAVILLLAALIVKTFATGLRAPDSLGGYICVGIAGIFFSQTLINLGMNLVLLPVIGVTLPLFSAGGTSVLTMYLSIGVVLSVYKGSKKTLFYD